MNRNMKSVFSDLPLTIVMASLMIAAIMMLANQTPMGERCVQLLSYQSTPCMVE